MSPKQCQKLILYFYAMMWFLIWGWASLRHLEYYDQAVLHSGELGPKLPVCWVVWGLASQNSSVLCFTILGSQGMRLISFPDEEFSFLTNVNTERTHSGLSSFLSSGFPVSLSFGGKIWRKERKRSKTDFVELTVCGPHFLNIYLFILFVKDKQRYLN